MPFLLQPAHQPLSQSSLIGALLRDGEVLFELQISLASPFLKFTVHRNDRISNRSIPKQGPKIIKRKGIKGELGALTKRSKML